MCYGWLFILVTYFLPILANAQPAKFEQIPAKLIQLEKKYNVSIAVFARKPGDKRLFEYQAYRLFPMQAKFNLLITGLTNPKEYNEALSENKIYYNKALLQKDPVQQQAILENTLSSTQQMRLVIWIKHHKTRDQKIEPINWIVADKTAAAPDEITNNIGIISSTANCKPIVLAIYVRQNKDNAKTDIITAVMRIIFNELAKNDRCLNNI